MDVDSLKVIKYKTNFITVLPIRLIVGGVQKIMVDIYSGSACISGYKVSMDSDSHSHCTCLVPSQPSPSPCSEVKTMFVCLVLSVKNP